MVKKHSGCLRTNVCSYPIERQYEAEMLETLDSFYGN